MAWKHEADHARSDLELGWPGFSYYVRRRDLWAEMEKRAYGIEIELASRAGYNELEKRLRALLAEELERLGVSDG